MAGWNRFALDLVRVGEHRFAFTGPGGERQVHLVLENDGNEAHLLARDGFFRLAVAKFAGESEELLKKVEELEKQMQSAARDMAGARGVGMRHVLVAGETFNGFRPCCPGDSRIRGVEELAEMFL